MRPQAFWVVHTINETVNYSEIIEYKFGALTDDLVDVPLVTRGQHADFVITKRIRIMSS